MAKRWGWAKLLSPYGAIPLRSVRVGQQVSQGWSGQVILQTPIPIDFDRKTEFQIVMQTDDGDFASGPMVANPRERTWDEKKKTIGLTFVDATLMKLAAPFRSWPTFIKSTSTAVVTVLLDGTHVSISGMPDWPIPIEDVKQQSPLDAFRRLMAAAGLEFTISSTGQLHLYRATQDFGTLYGDVKSAHETWNQEALCTGLQVERQSPSQGRVFFDFATSDNHTVAFPEPFQSASVVDESITGHVDQIGAWQGDPKSGGKLISMIYSSTTTGLNVPTTGSWPATHLSVNVYGSVAGVLTGEKVQSRIQVIGVPVSQANSPNLPAFRTFIGTQAWPAQPWVEPLIPSKAWVTAHSADYIWQRSRGYRQLAVERRPSLAYDIGVALQGRAWGEDLPRSRIESFSHTLLGTSLTCSVISY